MPCCFLNHHRMLMIVGFAAMKLWTTLSGPLLQAAACCSGCSGRADPRAVVAAAARLCIIGTVLLLPGRERLVKFPSYLSAVFLLVILVQVLRDHRCSLHAGVVWASVGSDLKSENLSVCYYYLAVLRRRWRLQILRTSRIGLLCSFVWLVERQWQHQRGSRCVFRLTAGELFEFD